MTRPSDPTASTHASSYTLLAAFYDDLMTHVDYDAWITFALERLNFPDRLPPGRSASTTEPADRPTILDLACGTGTTAVKLAERGYRVVGLDSSAEMLAVADAKARAASVPVFLTCQDLTVFEVDRPADAALCLFDSLNYLIDDAALELAFRRTASALKAGAPFLFDLHTECRLREIGQSTYAESGEDASYIWESEYDEVTRLCTMDVTLFVPQRPPRSQAAPLYVRHDETHYERAFTDDEVEGALAAAGFDLRARFGELRLEPPGADEGRIFYLAHRGL